ncbi:hypothetical protein TrRE_jg8807 [Triparma retinervis]|uniref:Uncharacterized protein n=1 Tax=Triparma retinervis TaxID=2557542 RepID=A0A9W7G751_9STRA|nr:hypothetical protein TrRE_jg8807 [Triparma retinervis]
MGLFGRLLGKKKNKPEGDAVEGGLDDDEGKKYSLKERQTWSLHLGEEPVNNRRSVVNLRGEQVYFIPHIDRTDLDEDRNFANLVMKIEGVTQKSLMPPEYYKMQYELPESPLKMNVDMGSHEQVMKAFDKFAKLGKKSFKKLRFRLMPKKKGAEMFRLDKPKTVKMRLDNRNNINSYLAQDFVRGRIELGVYSQIMGSKLGEAKAFLATHLAKTVKEEFADHQYLTKQKEKSKKRLSPEDRYDRGEITIEEFEDLKFPELKEKRIRELATYPLEEKLERCVICNQEGVAAIKCLECDHRACKGCVYREFTTHEQKRPFLLMHSVFCCKQGMPLRGYLPPFKKLHEGQYSRHPNIHK